MLLHSLPINQVFIDPFSEYIKHQDLMDISCSKFRDHSDPQLFDKRIFIINSEVTDREKIAQVLDYLTLKNTKAIGIDLLFDSLEHTRKDTLLRNAISHTKNIIFANTLEETRPSGEKVEAMRCNTFLVPDSLQYYVNLASDDEFTVRSFEALHQDKEKKQKAFSVALASMYQPEVIKDIESRKLKREWINFRRFQFGSAKVNTSSSHYSFPNYPIIGIDKFLNDTSSYSYDYFQNKIVLIGFCGSESDPSLKDRYFTPLNEKPSGRSFPDMHGVVIHANIISMLLDRDYINEVPSYRLDIIAFIIFFINYFIFLRVLNAKLFFTLIFIRIIQLIQFLLMFSISIWLLSNYNIKVGFVFLITSVIISYEMFEFYIHKIQGHMEKLLAKNNIVE